MNEQSMIEKIVSYIDEHIEEDLLLAPDRKGTKLFQILYGADFCRSDRLYDLQIYSGTAADTGCAETCRNPQTDC